MPQAELEALAAAAARAAVARVRAERPGRLEGRFAKLEEERLAQAALEWLAIDRGRPPFTVALREDELAIEAGGLAFRGRVDRLDRLEAGGLAVIDYKTGSPSVGGWLGERPDDPQLPLYALAAGDEVKAVAFACLRKGERGFIGLAREEGLLQGVGTVGKHRTAGKLHASWGELTAAWREATARLAAEFAAGHAPVDPKKRYASCTWCELGALCRIREKAVAEEGDDDDPASANGGEP
jgi:RecB family exonuclease